MRVIRYRDGIKEVEMQYPRMDMGIIENLDSGLEFKIIVKAELPIITDLERLERIETETNNAHPTYSHLKVVNITWNVIRKSDEEIQQRLEAAKSEANAGVFSGDREELLILTLGALIKLSRNESIPQKATTLLDNVLQKAVKVWQNDTVIKSKLQQLANGEDININTDWTNE